ncbi:DUF2871 domain-containing protein [Streptomyces yanii]|uniref:DUF2871 domain-containing protein n=1 Tax=Streptomyces yanii TaxID=78510 RepID=A0ABV5R4W3_9ACTN
MAAHVRMILGVISGLFDREFTKAHDFRGDTQLALMHTHLIALGVLGFLIVLALALALALDEQFQLSGTKLFTAFFWFYNAGIAITVTMMGVHGTETVLGKHVPEAVPWIAGLGHTLLTVGLILLFVSASGSTRPPRQGSRSRSPRRPRPEPSRPGRLS